MSDQPASIQNGYVIDVERNGGEWYRLEQQEKLMTRTIGGIFPPEEGLDLEHVHAILDLACGAGVWAREAANQLEVPCVGVDISPDMVRQARQGATIHALDDIVTFQQMDITSPLDFPDGSFDLINARFLVGFLKRALWPTVLKECWRLLRVGGYMVLTEAEWSSTNSQAGQLLARHAIEAFCKAGLGLSGDGRNLGVASALPALLSSAGYQGVKVETALLNFSFRQPEYHAGAANLWLAYSLMQPFLTRMGHGSKEELLTLCDAFAYDIAQDTFEAGMFLLRTWGQKLSEQPEPRQDFYLGLSLPSHVSSEKRLSGLSIL